MGKQVIQSRKFLHQHENGDAFNLNLGDFSYNLTGHVGERVSAEYIVDVSWSAEASTTNTFDGILTGVDWEIIRTTGSFLDDCFAIGDTVDMFYFSGGLLGPFAGTVTNVTDTSIFINSPALAASLPSGFTGSTSFQIFGTSPLEAFIGNFGIIENLEVANYVNKVEGSDQGYYASGVGTGMPRSTTFVPCIPLGTIKGWQTGNMEIRFVSNPTTYVQRFEVRHFFNILPYYIEGELTNLQSLTPPPLLAGSNTLKYVTQYEFRNVLSDPNTAKLGSDDIELGSVAWFEENFNGFLNNYSVVSIDYEDVGSGDPTDGLQISNTTQVTVVMNSAIGNFNANNIVVPHISFLPDAIEYEIQTDTYTDIWLLDSLRQQVGVGAVNGNLIKNLTATLDSPSQITVVFEVDYTGVSPALTEDDNYIIFINVAGPGLTTASSDKVALLADVNNYDQSPDIPGLMFIKKWEFFDHPTNLADGGYTNVKGWNEDGIVMQANIEIERTDLTTFIEELNCVIAAYNPVTGDRFDLTKVPINLSSAMIVTDPISGTGLPVQFFGIIDQRGFKLASGDQFDFLRFFMVSNALDRTTYRLVFGMKVDWQDWLALPGADTVFFDPFQPNNGLNHKASRYSLQNGYEIRFMIDAIISRGGVNTNYVFSSPTCCINDYDDDQFTPDQWMANIQTFNQAGADTDCNILNTENTVFQTTWDAPFVVSSLDSYVVIHRIEEFENPSKKEIYELSSIRPYPSGNLLVPEPFETNTTLQIVGGNIVSRCEIDYTQLDPGKSYKLSARLYGSNVLLGGKITEDDIQKITEGGIDKIIE